MQPGRVGNHRRRQRVVAEHLDKLDDDADGSVGPDWLAVHDPVRQATTDEVAQHAEANGDDPGNEGFKPVNAIQRREEPAHGMGRAERDHAQHDMLDLTHPHTARTPVEAMEKGHASPPSYEVTATCAKRQTSVRKLFLPLIRTTCSATGVILGGSSPRSCAAACCSTSTGAPCRFKSFNCSSVAKPSVSWQSYFSWVSLSSTVSLTV